MVAAGFCTTHGAFANDGWKTVEAEGRVEGRLDGELLVAWQKAPLAAPKGGAKFAASAFLHPMRTPAGFEWTAIQPNDHLHHFGVWWPWKYIQVGGKQHNTWEIQDGEGGHFASDAKVLDSGPERLAYQFHNRTIVNDGGDAPAVAIREVATVSIVREDDACVVDFHIQQKAAGGPVTIVEYRYSGYSWRGPLSWNRKNSEMLTSEGRNRDDANGTVARWVVVSGEAPDGKASVLLMTAAEEPEKLRVWDSSAHDGMPFVNFNPVQDRSMPLDDEHPAVSDRKYRIIAADHAIGATEAESAWKKWTGK